MNTGYKKSFEEFQLYLADASRYQISSLADIINLKAKKKSKEWIFVDQNGKNIQLFTVHKLIQNNTDTQKKFYSMWMSRFR